MRYFLEESDICTVFLQYIYIYIYIYIRKRTVARRRFAIQKRDQQSRTLAIDRGLERIGGESGLFDQVPHGIPAFSANFLRRVSGRYNLYPVES